MESFNSADNLKMYKWLQSIYITDPIYGADITFEAIKHTISTLNSSKEEIDDAVKTFPPKTKEQIEIFNCFYSYLKTVRDSSHD